MRRAKHAGIYFFVNKFDCLKLMRKTQADAYYYRYINQWQWID